MFDDEDPALGYLVDPPLLHDEAAPMLGYGSADALIRALDRVEPGHTRGMRPTSTQTT